jgi:ferredoxin--NADP+ reductase
MKIVSKEVLADCAGIRIVKLTLNAPEISFKARAGQFVVVMPGEKGERIPLTIVEADNKAETITLIFQEAGLTTKILGALGAGDNLYALAGPLGHATEIKAACGFGYRKPNHGLAACGRVILVGGGVGIAEIYPVAKSLKEAGNNITVIMGAKTKELLILEDKLKSIADKIYVLTDDGSYGQKGFVTSILEDLLKQGRYDLVYSVGPIPMMRKVAQISQSLAIKTIVSLNALMVDATGMCGCCRVTVAGQVKFSCVDGPEFEAKDIDWDELEKRNCVYVEREKHICRLNNLENR